MTIMSKGPRYFGFWIISLNALCGAYTVFSICLSGKIVELRSLVIGGLLMVFYIPAFNLLYVV
jgi:hypothetical protein